MIELKSPNEIAIIKRGGHIVAQTLELIGRMITPGITTGELDRAADTFIRHHNARPAFKGYHGFPASVCISINEEVVHGIPGNRKLQAGQIVSVDVGVELEGYYADGAATFAVAEISSQVARLLQVTREALAKGIKQATVGNRVSDISAAIQNCAETNGFSVVRDLVGHGIGRQMHEEPQVPNYGLPHDGPELKPGLVLAIEPMVNAGGWEVILKPDRWTVVTKDGSWSAHFEHTIAITQSGPEVLTQ